jgi:LDH2 family malate/lactate/ureidoglycolate dehydrogenase
MNVPPVEAVRVPPAALQQFVEAILSAVGMEAEHARLLAHLLVTNDLRGVFSHGTRQVATYARDLRAGALNPRPQIRVRDETPTTFALDGDGGLGYFAAWRAAHEIVDRARTAGVAVAVTRNHGHIGAAGLYPRIPAAAGLLAYCTSGHQLHLQPGASYLQAAGGSPMSFALPTGTEPPVVLDFGTMHHLYEGEPHVAAIAAAAPGLVFRSVGLGAVCQAVGGFLAGVPARPERARRQWSGANQGAFLLAVDIARFMPLAQFRSEMDDYARQVRQLRPLPGYDVALLPGELEWRREQAWAQEGVPVGRRHQEILHDIGAELGVAPPI